MNLELYDALDEGVAKSMRLYEIIQEDKKDIRRCVKGEILEAYLRATDAAEQELQKLQEQMVDLRNRQRLIL